MKTLKICRECKWCQVGTTRTDPGEDPGNFDLCNCPKRFKKAKPSQVSLVSGVMKESYLVPIYGSEKYCGLQREVGFMYAWLTPACGKRGKWFEPQGEKDAI